MRLFTPAGQVEVSWYNEILVFIDGVIYYKKKDYKIR